MDLKELLNLIGYTSLSDDGPNYWRHNAVYRDGDNKTSLRINKKTGRFTDFVEGQSGSIDDLIKITLGFDNVKLEEFYKTKNIDSESIINEASKPKIEIEREWGDELLLNLLPHYKFYEERGISKETLKFFKSGFAHSGSMNQRYVFPIYNQNEKICGWSGRDMTGKKDAKWKHMGKKTSWIYPVFIKDGESFPVKQDIKNTKEIILVESIGDMLSLWENGYKNVLVTFGLRLSSKLGSFLMTQNVDNVVIALNNDQQSDENRGRDAAKEMFLDLMRFVDVNKIKVCLPIKKDFGEMNSDDFVKWSEQKQNVDKSLFMKEVLDLLKFKYKHKVITQNEVKFGKTISGIINA